MLFIPEITPAYDYYLGMESEAQVSAEVPYRVAAS